MFKGLNWYAVQSEAGEASPIRSSSNGKGQRMDCLPTKITVVV